MSAPLTIPGNNNQARLLIVDDEPHIRMALVEILSLEGYFTEEAYSGTEALELLRRKPYDLMVLDLNLPGMGGVEVMEEALRLNPNLLIIILTGHGSLESAIAAVKSKAADYLLKPTDAHTLVNAINRALQERMKELHQQRLVQVALNALRQIESPADVPPKPPPSEPYLQASPIILDREKRQVLIEDDSGSRRVKLTKNETAILAELMNHHNQTISCQELVHTIWGRDLNETEAQNVIRPYIFRLRCKIESSPKYPRLIRTIRGQGYLFTATEG
jgi:DNA-binding response OmpR family regulator